MKKYLIPASIIVIIWLIFQFYSKALEQSREIRNQALQQGKQEETVKQQTQTITIQNEVIKERKKVVKRKNINRTIPTNDNLLWLKAHRCKDCQSK
jgi:uncharacterized protein YpmB